MDMYEIIKTKRDGGRLTKEQIDFFVTGSVNHEIPDYQISALLMAIFLNHLDDEETSDLTMAMKYSGEVLDLTQINGIKVDKHSTGGVGDKTTLICAPIVAAAGVPVAKMSGRGLGFTGGTIDKLESIPGYRTGLSIDEFIKQVNDLGISVIGQTDQVAAADKIFYALRDVTATVENISLIASSILSKKLVLGSDGIVFDVKCGEGSFMKTEKDAKKLGRLLVDTAKRQGKNAIAVISDMNQPLGNAVGNGIEVIEAIETLKGKGPADITKLSIILAGLMIYIGGKAGDTEEGQEIAKEILYNGSALEKLKGMISNQSGNKNVCDDYSLFKKEAFTFDYESSEEGYIAGIKGDLIGRAAMHTGAGRLIAGEDVDPGAGIYMTKKIGDFVKPGDVLCHIYTDHENRLDSVKAELKNAFTISNKKPVVSDLIKEIIR